MYNLVVFSSRVSSYNHVLSVVSRRRRRRRSPSQGTFRNCYAN
jgi:hypothetical protein